MATGFDRRQPTRDSFALQPATPAQARPTQSGQSRGAQIVGGESRGGAVAAGPQTDAAPVAAGLGQFVEEFMRPHVQRRQQEQFAEGFAKAASGAAVEELHRSNGPLAKVFGPNSYEEGAAAYTAKSAVEKWFADQYADTDALKKLPPAELGKLYSAGLDKLGTGDPLTDGLVQQGMMAGFMPLASTIAKERTAWLKGEAINAWTTAAGLSAKNLQSAAVAQAALSDPSDDENAAFTVQARAFLGGMAKPEGMDDDAYRSGLVGFMRGAMQDGNFYAVKLMREAGVDSVLSEDERVKLEDAERRYADRTLEDFTSTDPGFIRMAQDYEERRAHTAIGQGGDPKVMSPMEAATRLGNMNAYVRARTGVETDLFDFKEVRGETRSMADLVVSAIRRAQDRTWQVEDRAYARETRRLEGEAEDRETAREAGVAWASGDVEAAMVGGLEQKHFNRLALRDFRQGNLDGLARAFRVGHYVSDAVKREVAAGVESTLDQQYGKTFETAHERWRTMVAANPGMARAYYGEWHDKLRAFDTLSRQVGPTAAYTRAFGDAARYSGVNIDAGLRKQAGEAVKAAVADRQPSWWNPWGGPTFTPDAVRVMENVLTERVAMGLHNSDATPALIAKESLDAAMADGSLQVAAGQAWRAPAGSKPFRTRIGLQQDEADAVFDDLVDARLKKAGLRAGTGAHLDVAYVNLPSGQEALTVLGRDDDGNSRRVIIGLPDFKAAAGNRARAEVESSQPSQAYFDARKAHAAGLDPYRRIKGEKGWQRVRRINLEVKAGSSPTR